MIGKLGRPYKVVYVAKNFVSGLTNIVAKVEKPNGSHVGLFPMIEDVDSFYAGSYYFNLSTTLADPEGEYTVSIVEPTSQHREIFKVTLENQINVDVTFNFEDFDVKGKVNLVNNLLGRILPSPLLIGAVQSITPLLKGSIVSNSLTGRIISTNLIKGKIIQEC